MVVDTADLLQRLAARAETLAVAESLTGGGLAAALTDVPGSSAVFLGGVVSYATAVKEQVLGVPPEVVAGPGVVSAACAEAMASGVRALLGSTWALSTTGVAGPGPQDGVPAGTAYVAVAGAGGVLARRVEVTGDRGEVRAGVVAAALALLAEWTAG